MRHSVGLGERDLVGAVAAAMWSGLTFCDVIPSKEEA